MSDASAPSPRSRRWTLYRLRALLRSRGPTSVRFRRRIAVITGAILIGIVAVLFAEAADYTGLVFSAYARTWHWLPLVTTPLGFMALVWLTRRFVPLARGSGIPQVMAAQTDPTAAMGGLIAVKTVLGKVVLTMAAILCGASVGREGPTVQIAAAVMGISHRVLRVPLKGAVVIAGGAAGVAAAVNTPLAGVMFAIEELAAAYEQKVTLLVLSAIVIAGLVAQSLAGDYIYFGAIGAHMPTASALIVVPVAGVFGGLAGGLFSRVLLGLASGPGRVTRWTKANPVLFAGICGVVVAVLGVFSAGLTWGTGYSAARAMIIGVDAPLWFGPAARRHLRAQPGGGGGRRQSAACSLPERSRGRGRDPRHGRLFRGGRARAADRGDHPVRNDGEPWAAAADVRHRLHRRLGEPTGVPREAVSRAVADVSVRRATTSP